MDLDKQFGREEKASTDLGRKELFKMRILSSFVLDFYKTINKTYVSQHEYYGLLNRIKITKYIRKEIILCYSTYFPILNPDYKCVVADDGDCRLASLLPVSGLVDCTPQS